MLLAVPALGLLHDVALQFSPFGGLGLPRYLIYTFPFALAALGLVYRALPLTTLALAAVSTIQMALMTATNPLAAYDLDWVGRASPSGVLPERGRLRRGDRLVHDPAFFAVVGVAALAAFVLLPETPLQRHDVLGAAFALALWVLVAARARTPDGGRHDLAYLVAVAIAAALPALAFALRTMRPRLQPQPG